MSNDIFVPTELYKWSSPVISVFTWTMTGHSYNCKSLAASLVTTNFTLLQKNVHPPYQQKPIARNDYFICTSCFEVIYQSCLKRHRTKRCAKAGNRAKMKPTHKKASKRETRYMQDMLKMMVIRKQKSWIQAKGNLSEPVSMWYLFEMKKAKCRR